MATEAAALPPAAHARRSRWSWWHDGNHVAGAVLLAAFVLHLLVLGWTAPRETSGAEFDPAFTGYVLSADKPRSPHSIDLVPWGSDALTPHKDGQYVVWAEDGRVHWTSFDETNPRMADLRKAPERQAGELTATREWAARASLAIIILAVGVVSTGARPLAGTRWYWLWMCTLPLGLGILLFTLTEKLSPPSQKWLRRTRTGGEGFFISIGLSFLITVAFDALGGL